MINVHFFGLLRLDYGIKNLSLDASNQKELLKGIEAASGIPVKALKGCVVLVNGKPIKFNQKLHDGDEVMLMPSVCGG